ncbi:MAG: SDR family oxidoreductase [Clostridium sp.]|nr:SDR family oxidoreductase [Clostridium sp.]
MDLFKENFSLEGKKAIVTGGARGLCNGIAQAYHDAGAQVVLVDVLESVSEAAEAMSTDDAKVFAVRGDLSKPEDIARICEESLSLLGGRVDILLNGAGIQHRCPAADFPTEKWNQIISINLNAVFLMAQTIGRQMIEQKYGKIINIASMLAFFGGINIPAYAASKGAVGQLTKALSNEWAGHGVNVNAIAPGYMATELTDTMKRTDPKQYASITERIPKQRWGSMEDLQGISVFLASDASSYITGAVIPVDGGYLAR